MRTSGKRTIAAVLAAVALQAMMIFAFGWPSARMAPRDVPLVVAGPQAPAAAIADRLAHERPGSFEITRLPDEAAARQALTDRGAYGAIVVTPAGPRVLIASAASQVLAQQLGQLAQQLSGQPAALSAAPGSVPVHDVVPSDSDDPRGAAFGSLVLPLAMSSIAAGLMLSVLVPWIGRRLIGLLGFAIVGGLATTAIVQDSLSVLPGSYLTVAGVAGLTSLAVAGTVTSLTSIIGRPGTVLGALTMLVLGIPLSAATSAPELLPQPWGAVGQVLPPGAASTLLRSVAFFDGADASGPLIVLLAWVSAGFVVTLAGLLRARRRARVVVIEAPVTPAEPVAAR